MIELLIGLNTFLLVLIFTWFVGKLFPWWYALIFLALCAWLTGLVPLLQAMGWWD